MARKAKKSGKKTGNRAKRAARKPTGRSTKTKKTKKKAARRKTAGAKPRTTKSQRRQREPIPADPAGRIGASRPSNEPKAPGLKEPRELAQREPDARFDDRRDPERTAHDLPDGTEPPAPG